MTMRKRVDEVAEHLVGTCQALESVATPEECDDTYFLSALNEQTFQCDNCGWWCDIEEHHEGDLCDDCHDEQE